MTKDNRDTVRKDQNRPFCDIHEISSLDLSFSVKDWNYQTLLFIVLKYNAIFLKLSTSLQYFWVSILV